MPSGGSPRALRGPSGDLRWASGALRGLFEDPLGPFGKPLALSEGSSTILRKLSEGPTGALRGASGALRGLFEDSARQPCGAKSLSDSINLKNTLYFSFSCFLRKALRFLDRTLPVGSSSSLPRAFPFGHCVYSPQRSSYMSIHELTSFTNYLLIR